MTMIQDEELLSKFEDTSLPLSEFRHEEHLRVAFLYLRRHALLEVLKRSPAALQRYAAAHGKTGLHLRSISLAYPYIHHERLAAGGETETWEEFKQRHGDLLECSK